MYKTLTTQSAYTFFNNFFKETDKNFILDPLSCVIRLAILSFKPTGTKISITRNKISYNEPSILQGTIRWSQGDNRDDLHNIYNPLRKATEWFDISSSELTNIFKLAVNGLEKLKSAYNNNSTISHSIDRYIIILKAVENNRSGPKTRQSDSQSESGIESNHIFDELKQLWNEREINIINNLLLEVDDCYNKDINIDHLIYSLESLLSKKEEVVHDLLIKTTTILE